jgi:hypothetical protein
MGLNWLKSGGYASAFFTLKNYTKYMETLKVDRTKLITQAEYARRISKTRGWVNQQIKAGNLKTVKIEGAVLIYLQ